MFPSSHKILLADSEPTLRSAEYKIYKLTLHERQNVREILLLICLLLSLVLRGKVDGPHKAYKVRA